MNGIAANVLLLILLWRCFTAAYCQYRFHVSPLLSGEGEIPSPRSDHLTVVVNTQNGFFLIIHGGRDENGGKTDTWYYHVNSNRWKILRPQTPLTPNEPPPPMYGAVGGYRFVKGYADAFLYVTLGTSDGKSEFYNDMWAMDLTSFTWRKVRLDGEIPSPRFAAAGALERFVKSESLIQPELVISHGLGQDGPLSDTFKCIFNETDPYRATWKRLHSSVNQYSPREPHPMYMQGSAFTAKRDLILFGGCYSSMSSGGYCPSHHAWVLQYTQEKVQRVISEDNHGQHILSDIAMPGTESVSWKRVSGGPLPRLSPGMAQALNSFKDAYSSWESIAVVYSGDQNSSRLRTRQLLSAKHVRGDEIALVSSKENSWIREEVHYVGPIDSKDSVLMGRSGASMSIVRETNASNEIDIPNEFYLLFGGLLENGTFSNSLLRLSFDPFSIAHPVTHSNVWFARPQLHGVLMFLSWGVLMVFGVFIIRFSPRTSRNILAHVVLQSIAVLLGWIGLRIALYSRGGRAGSFAHANIGFILMVTASLQPVSVIAASYFKQRLGIEQLNHEGLAPRTGIQNLIASSPWKTFHHICGVVMLCLGFINITLGLFLVVAPLLLWAHWLIYSILLTIVTFWMELTRRKRARFELT